LGTRKFGFGFGFTRTARFQLAKQRASIRAWEPRERRPASRAPLAASPRWRLWPTPPPPALDALRRLRRGCPAHPQRLDAPRRLRCRRPTRPRRNRPRRLPSSAPPLAAHPVLGATASSPRRRPRFVVAWGLGWPGGCRIGLVAVVGWWPWEALWAGGPCHVANGKNAR